jgi:hypothetical protein
VKKLEVGEARKVALKLVAEEYLRWKLLVILRIGEYFEAVDTTIGAIALTRLDAYLDVVVDDGAVFEDEQVAVFVGLDC